MCLLEYVNEEDRKSTEKMVEAARKKQNFYITLNEGDKEEDDNNNEDEDKENVDPNANDYVAQRNTFRDDNDDDDGSSGAVACNCSTNNEDEMNNIVWESKCNGHEHVTFRISGDMKVVDFCCFLKVRFNGMKMEELKISIEQVRQYLFNFYIKLVNYNKS